MIEYRAVYKAFDAPVLTGVDLRIENGETMAIVGRSGTGKSVLLKTTLGLVVPDRGDVRVEGDSVVHGSAQALRRIRRKVGYVFQNAALFDSMTVFENVTQGLPASQLATLTRAEAVRRVAIALEHVHLEPAAVLGKLPAELSGGMRKRVGLARAIIGNPEFLLYDEPVTGLDPVTGGVVHRLIAQLARELGVTSVVVTHEIDGALAISDRIALLERGRIHFVGTPAQFRASDDALVRAFLDRDQLTPAGALEAL